MMIIFLFLPGMYDNLKRYFILLSGIVALIPAAAQSHTKDSLLRLAVTSLHDTIRANIYLQLSKLEVFSNLSESYDFAVKGIQLAQKSGWSNTYVFYSQFATMAQLNNQPDSALYYNRLNYEGALAIGNVRNQGIALNNMANAAIFSNDLQHAYLYAIQALEKNKEAGNQLGMAISQQIIGSVENDFGNTQKALLYLNEAGKNYYLSEDTVYAATIECSMAEIYLKLHLYEKTKYHLNKALKTIGKNGDSFFFTSYYEILGKYYQRKGNPDSAIIYLKEGAKHANEIGAAVPLISIEAELSKVYFDLKKYRDALEIASRNIDAAMEGHLFDISSALSYLISQIHQINGNHKEALFFYQIHKQYNDSLFDAAKTKQLAAMSIKYETGKKTEENERLKVDNENRKQQLYLIILSVIILFLSVAFIIGIILFNKKKTDRLNKELSELNSTKDKLFGIISHDLRAPLASTQMLGYLILSKDIPETELKSLAKELSLISGRTSDMLDNLLNWAHSQIKGIHVSKSTFLVSDVVDELKELLNASLHEKQLNLMVQIPEKLNITADKEMFTFILRNLLTNAIKFTYTNGTIVINYIPQKFVFEVSDNGTGIPPDQVKMINHSRGNMLIGSTRGTQKEKGTGLGLILIKSFIEKHGGHFTAYSEPGKGSRFEFSLNG